MRASLVLWPELAGTLDQGPIAEHLLEGKELGP